MKIKEYKKFLESVKKFPNLKEVNIEGFKVIIGRDSESNDYLTTKMANPDDLWFHTKGSPGSHILIRVSDVIPTDGVIREVAKLAIKNSKAKTEGTVVYCKSKFVKKEPGMKPGQVSVDYKNSYEIKINI